jgi:hypothetical protein
MDQAKSNGVARAKIMLSTVKYASMATVNSDGTPHNTPFTVLYDPELKYIYWGSSPESRHSKNIMKTKQAFIVIYDSLNGDGLYIETEDVHILESDELVVALKIHNNTRSKRGQDLLTLGYYTGQSPQRMWSATPVHFWVNNTERDADGRISKDYRIEINQEDLIN